MLVNRVRPCVGGGYNGAMSDNEIINHGEGEDGAALAWARLLDTDEYGRGLIAEIEACLREGDAGANDLLRWRERYGKELAEVGVELVRGRIKARGKFTDEHVEKMCVDVSGVEQATSFDIAVHKARRFEQAGAREVFDLCCGIGGDCMGFGHVLSDARIVAVDMNAVRVMMARHNTALVAGRGIGGVVGDVTQLGFEHHARAKDVGIHFDPARRGGGRRKHRYEDYLPGPAFIEQLMGTYPCAMVKLGPGVDFELLPEGEVELISRDGVLVQGVLYGEGLSEHIEQRTATQIITDGATLTGQVQTLRGMPGPLWDDAEVKAGDLLYTVDPAVERAELMSELGGELDLRGVHPRLGLLVGDRVMESSWVKGYRVLDVMSWREKKVKGALKSLGAGVVSVKTRGVTIDTDVMQKRLRGDGDRALVVFIQRLGKRQMAYLAQRMD